MTILHFVGPYKHIWKYLQILMDGAEGDYSEPNRMASMMKPPTTSRVKFRTGPFRSESDD